MWQSSYPSGQRNDFLFAKSRRSPRLRNQCDDIANESSIRIENRICQHKYFTLAR